MAAPKKTTAAKKPAPNTKAPKGSYALPGGGPSGADAYPVTSKAQAVSALARVEANGTAAEKAQVRKTVAAKYPSLPSSKGKGNSAAAKASPKRSTAKKGTR